MDTGKEYIKMCDCKEIQDLSPETDPFYVEYKFGDKSKVIIEDGQFWFIEVQPEGSEEYDIWLPRQDQLQEMLKETHLSTPLSLIEFLYSELNDDESCPEIPCCKECKDNALYFKSFKTMEQLWLAFVMSEKFGRIWNKNKWIKKEK